MSGRSAPARALAIGLALAAALALALVGVRAVRGSPRDRGSHWPDPPVFRLAPGVERAYEVRVRSDGRLGGPGAGDGAGVEAFSLELRGVLVLRPYQASAGQGLEVGARLWGAHVTREGPVPSYATGLDAPFSFHLDPHGRFTALRFGRQVSGETAALLEQLLVRIELVLPREGRAAWISRERDAAGLYRAAYRVDPATPLAVEKRKLEYLPADGGDPPPQVMESRSTFELEPELRGVRRVEGAEVLRRRAGALQGREAVSFRYELTESPGALPATLAELARARDEARGPAEGAAAPTRAIPPASAASEILGAFAAAFGSDRAAAEALVLAWLHQPAAPGELVRWLDVMNRDPEQAALDAAKRAVLWRLLAQAGTPEAEAALLDAAVSLDHPPLSRRQAAGHFGQVAVARPAMVEGLLGIYDAGCGPGRPADEGLGAMALLAVGSLGHPDLAPEELTGTVVAALTGRLSHAVDRTERETVLAAMGNVGEPCLPALRAALADPDPALRAAAVNAFRRMETAEARRALQDHATAETDASVRARTVEMLQRLARTGR